VTRLLVGFSLYLVRVSFWREATLFYLILKEREELELRFFLDCLASARSFFRRCLVGVLLIFLRDRGRVRRLSTSIWFRRWFIRGGGWRVGRRVWVFGAYNYR
jgi:hypothetical protein